jgi:hypothetical protein
VGYQIYSANDTQSSLIITLNGEAVFFAARPQSSGNILLNSEPADGANTLLAFIFHGSVESAFGVRLDIATDPDPGSSESSVSVQRSVVSIEPLELEAEAWSSYIPPPEIPAADERGGPWIHFRRATLHYHCAAAGR